MPNKAQINRRRRMNAKLNEPKPNKVKKSKSHKPVERLKYCNRFTGVNDEILSCGIASLDRDWVGGFNAHYWLKDKYGNIKDPTPLFDTDNIPRYNGKIKRHYEEFSEDIQQHCNRVRQDALIDWCEDEEITEEEYVSRYTNPQIKRCYLNCIAYLLNNPREEWTLVCGAFGFKTNMKPNPCPSCLVGLKEYIALDFGY